MKKTKQILFTITGIVFTILLFLFAMYLPRYLNAFFDEKTLNKVTQRELNLKTYELSYNSFYEKLHAIARCKKEELHVVAVQETDGKQEKEKITKIIQREISLLSQERENIMFQNITLKPSDFVSCETFTLYSSGDAERLKGITYWKITYQKKKERFIFYLDEEYHKIYALEVTRKESSVMDNILNDNVISKSEALALGYKIDDVDSYVIQNLSYYYMGSMIRYLGLEVDQFEFCDEEEGLNVMGDFLFADKYTLRFGCQWEREVRKNGEYITMILGIYLDQMLQF